MEIKINNDIWFWSFDYDDGLPQSTVHGMQKYGDHHPYKGESIEELTQRAKKRKQEIITKIKTLCN